MGFVTGVLSFFIAKIFRIAGAILAGWGLFRIIFLDAGLVVPIMLVLVGLLLISINEYLTKR